MGIGRGTNGTERGIGAMHPAAANTKRRRNVSGGKLASGKGIEIEGRVSRMEIEIVKRRGAGTMRETEIVSVIVVMIDIE